MDCWLRFLTSKSRIQFITLKIASQENPADKTRSPYRIITSSNVKIEIESLCVAEEHLLLIKSEWHIMNNSNARSNNKIESNNRKARKGYHDRERRVRPALRASRHPVHTPEATMTVRSSVSKTIRNKSSIGRSFQPVITAPFPFIPIPLATIRFWNQKSKSFLPKPPSTIFSCVYGLREGKRERKFTRQFPVRRNIWNYIWEKGVH